MSDDAVLSERVLIIYSHGGFQTLDRKMHDDRAMKVDPKIVGQSRRSVGWQNAFAACLCTL